MTASPVFETFRFNHKDITSEETGRDAAESGARSRSMTASPVLETFRFNHKDMATEETGRKLSWDHQSATSSDTVNNSNGSIDVGEWLTIKSGLSSFNNAKTSLSGKRSDGTTGETEVSLGAKSSGRMESCESVKTSIVPRASPSSCVSDSSESFTSSVSFHSGNNKPHKANDRRWEAIQVVKARDGALGLNHFKLLKRLGCGDIGSVYLAELKGSNCYFAMKVMDKGSLASRNKLPRAQTEREILALLDHPFLPTLYTHFETEKYSCLVMEFCTGGDLHTLRQRQPGKHFTESAARFYASEVLMAVEYLHMMGVVYRDLKPENVLVREDGHIMLSDFDLSMRCVVSPTLVKGTWSDLDPRTRIPAYCITPSCTPACIQPTCVQPSRFIPKLILTRMRKVKPDKSKVPWMKSGVHHQVSPLPELIAEPTAARSMSFVGTHEYLAPEIIKGEGHGSAVDWWTFGIFLYELLHGKTPFKGAGNRATIFNIVGQPLKFPETSGVNFAARDLMTGLLVKEPTHRLACKRGAGEIKQHPFFEGVNWALIRCTTPPDVPQPFELEVTLSRRNPKEGQLPETPPKAESETPPPAKKKAAAESNTSDGPNMDFDFF